MIWAVVVIIVVIVLASIVLSYRAKKKRREALAAWSRQRGWQLTESDDSYTKRFEGTPFGTGDNRQARNIMTGRAGDRSCVVFDYRYDTHSTDSKGNRTTSTHWFEIVAVSLPRTVPSLEVGREGVFGTMARAVGIKDIELENEDFNRQFKVKSPDAKFAYDVLHPRMMQWLMESGFDRPWRIDGGEIMSWRNGRTKLERVDGSLTFLGAVIDRVPGFAWDREPQP